MREQHIAIKIKRDTKTYEVLGITSRDDRDLNLKRYWKKNQMCDARKISIRLIVCLLWDRKFPWECPAHLQVIHFSIQVNERRRGGAASERRRHRRGDIRHTDNNCLSDWWFDVSISLDNRMTLFNMLLLPVYMLMRGNKIPVSERHATTATPRGTLEVRRRPPRRLLVYILFCEDGQIDTHAITICQTVSADRNLVLAFLQR